MSCEIIKKLLNPSLLLYYLPATDYNILSLLSLSKDLIKANINILRIKVYCI